METSFEIQLVQDEQVWPMAKDTTNPSTGNQAVAILTARL